MLALISISLLDLVSGVLSGIVGTGSSIVMLPVLVMLYGLRMAIPPAVIEISLAGFFLAMTP